MHEVAPRAIGIAHHDLHAPVVRVVGHADERATSEHLRANFRIIDLDGGATPRVAVCEAVERGAPVARLIRRRRPGDAMPELERLTGWRWRHREHRLWRGVQDARRDAADEHP